MTIAVDSLIDSAAGTANQVENTQASRRRFLFLQNDSADLTVVAVNHSFKFSVPVLRIDAATAVADTLGCLRLSARSVELLSYALENTTISVISSRSFAMDFLPIPAYRTALRTASADEILTIEMLPKCLVSRMSPNAVNLTFLRPVPAPTPAFAVAQRAFVATQFLAVASGGGLVAVSAARSTVVLRLFPCLPEFDQDLGVMENPFRQRLTDDQDGQFLAATVMNHLFMIGLPLLHMLVGWTYARVRQVPIREGFAWVKFPSLSLIPLQFLVETTCSSAVVVLIYATAPTHRFAAVLSLLVTICLIVAIPGHVLRSLASRFISRPRPDLERAREKQFMIPGPVDGEDFDGKKSKALQKLKVVLEWILYFLDSDSKWVDADPENKKGYTRANEMLFDDYNGYNYWFMGVEVGVAGIMGVLEGIQLGPGRCTPVSFTILMVLIVFLLVMVVRLPYHTLLDSYFNVVVTITQVTGAIYATVGLATQTNDPYKQRTELMTTIGLYLLIGKAVLDVLIKLKELIQEAHERHLHSQKQKKVARSEALKNIDLTGRLVEAIQEANVENDVKVLLEVPTHSPEADIDSAEMAPPLRLPTSPPRAPPRWELDWDPSEFVSLALPVLETEIDDGTDLLRRRYKLEVENDGVDETEPTYGNLEPPTSIQSRGKKEMDKPKAPQNVNLTEDSLEAVRDLNLGNEVARRSNFSVQVDQRLSSVDEPAQRAWASDLPFSRTGASLGALPPLPSAWELDWNSSPIPPQPLPIQETGTANGPDPMTRHYTVGVEPNGNTESIGGTKPRHVNSCAAVQSHSPGYWLATDQASLEDLL